MAQAPCLRCYTAGTVSCSAASCERATTGCIYSAVCTHPVGRDGPSPQAVSPPLPPFCRGRRSPLRAACQQARRPCHVRVVRPCSPSGRQHEQPAGLGGGAVIDSDRGANDRGTLQCWRPVLYVCACPQHLLAAGLLSFSDIVGITQRGDAEQRAARPARAIHPPLTGLCRPGQAEQGERWTSSRSRRLSTTRSR